MIELRQEYTYLCKSKIRNEKIENETLKRIEKDYNSLLILSDHKNEIENELRYLCEYHLKKSNEIIENYSKYVQANIESGLIIPNIIDETPLPLYEEPFSQPTSSIYIFKYRKSLFKIKRPWVFIKQFLFIEKKEKAFRSYNSVEKR